MPIVGMRSREVMTAASCSGTSSRTIEKAPACWIAIASESSARAVVARLALDLDLAAEAVLRLRRPADVAHDRHAGLHERLDDPRAADPALDLDRLRAAVLHEPAGVLGRLARSSSRTGTACRR